jgi:heat shock protein HtpX
LGPGDVPELQEIVTRLAALADAPVPGIAVAPTDLPNAFAVGVHPGLSTLVVTRGLGGGRC